MALCSRGATGRGSILVRTAALAVLVALAACGGKSSQNASASTGGAGAGVAASGGTSGAGGGTLGGATGCYDDGTVPITPEQRQTILSSACQVVRSEWPQSLEIVIDASSALDDPDPDKPSQSRWDSTRDLLLSLVTRDDRLGLQESVVVGLRFVATDPVGGACGNLLRVPSDRIGAAGSAQRNLLAQALTVFRPREAPLRTLYGATVAELLAPRPLTAQPQILLVTDGAPNLGAGCGGQPDDADLFLKDLLAAAVEGVRTIVLATPGSDANSAWLSTAAPSGNGAPPCGGGRCYYGVTSHPEFGAELEALMFRGDLSGGCSDFSFPTESERPLDPEKTALLFTFEGQTTLVPRACSTNCTMGFRLLTDSSLRLCPDTCALAFSELNAVLELAYGCAD